MVRYPGIVFDKEIAGEDSDLAVSLSAIKDHLRIDFDDADNELKDFVFAAQDYVQEYCNVSLPERVLKYRVHGRFYKNIPFSNGFWLPYPPIVAIEGVSSKDKDGNSTDLVSVTDYSTRDQHNKSKSLVLVNPKMDEEYEIEYRAGYGNIDDVPKRIRQAIKVLVGSWYDNRESILTTGAVPKEIPRSFASLVEMFRHSPGT